MVLNSYHKPYMIYMIENPVHRLLACVESCQLLLTPGLELCHAQGDQDPHHPHTSATPTLGVCNIPYHSIPPNIDAPCSKCRISL